MELREMQGTLANDPHQGFDRNITSKTTRCVLISGPVIVGAGPSGLAVAACLKGKGVPSMVIEREDCIASLWKKKTYDRLSLHLPKKFCELPLMPFPKHFPKYPSKGQFIEYLEDYARKFDIKPVFRETVQHAEFDQTLGFWRVQTACKETGFDRQYLNKLSTIKVDNEVTEYVCRWLVVATGENAEEVVPELAGLEEFGGKVVHSSSYKSGEEFRGKRVLVVGCGNSGMEVCLDLCHHNAMPSIVVRDRVHILPREMLGRSTFGLSMLLLKWFPITLVDSLLLFVAWFMFGDTSKLGLTRPKMGPLRLKSVSGKTPVLDVGTIDNIRRGNIQVYPSIKRLRKHAVEFINGRVECFDAIVLATGYKSNVPFWLKEGEMFSEKDGVPKKGYPNGWKGESGLYAAGFTKRGLLGTSMDATRIAEDIAIFWISQSKQYFTYFDPNY